MEADSSDTRLGAVPVSPIDTRGFAPGTIVADRYRIVALAGRGGMGEVYRADDQRVGQSVALKFLPAKLEHDPEARERLIAEVRNARTISHPNICRVYDIGDVHGRYFLTMEYIDGEDLASLLRRIGRLPAPKALEIARQLCAGLSAAHDRGVLHRDLKPANVMIDGRGHARITDFGLAVEAGPTTSPADWAGTVAYMAPERFLGKPATVQSDLYSLGLVLYETYTGKTALTAATIGDWQRAHTDSTPTSPSALVTEIEPAVERAIMRCLEKDAAKRPASAAQAAAALPGGDPLAAAIAAGETPSPELVAASGEEGTLPRARAWLSLAGCLTALALAVPLASQWHLANLVPARDPLLQQETAREILRDIGYTAAPADSAWWFRTDADYMRRLAQMPPRMRFVPVTTLSQSPFVFCYRQSPESLFVWSPSGIVTSAYPPPLLPDDVVVELNPDGGLRTLRAGGIGFGWRPAPGGHPPWPRLFTAAGLSASEFTDTAPKWTPVFAFDTQVAWEGRHGEEALRVEAASYRGRPTEFRVIPASLEPAQPTRPAAGWSGWIADVIVIGLFYASLAVPVVLARRNARLGRGDRKGALQLALVTFAVEGVVLLLKRHWTLEPMNVALVPIYLFGLAFFVAAATGLSYLGLEPYIRRRSPGLLIAWTRLLEGRWRDPLVGRSLLAGTTAALCGAAIVPGLAAMVTRTVGWPIALPWSGSPLEPAPLALGEFFADHLTGLLGILEALIGLALLLIARIVARHDRVAWAVLSLIGAGVTTWAFLLAQPWLAAAPLGALLFPVVLGGITVALLARHGLLATTVMATVTIGLLGTPLTYDLTRWYAWRTMILAAIVVGLAVWGFRNVLGRQSAFPSGALEE